MLVFQNPTFTPMVYYAVIDPLPQYYNIYIFEKPVLLGSWVFGLVHEPVDGGHNLVQLQHPQGCLRDHLVPQHYSL